MTEQKRNPFHKPHRPSPELSVVIGSIALISRPQATKKVWEYIKRHELQDPENKRLIVLDGALLDLFPEAVDRVNMFEVPKMLSRELGPV